LSPGRKRLWPGRFFQPGINRAPSEIRSAFRAIEPRASRPCPTNRRRFWLSCFRRLFTLFDVSTSDRQLPLWKSDRRSALERSGAGGRRNRQAARTDENDEPSASRSEPVGVDGSARPEHHRLRQSQDRAWPMTRKNHRRAAVVPPFISTGLRFVLSLALPSRRNCDCQPPVQALSVASLWRIVLRAGHP
jgi:hypothetical protein